MEPAPEGGSGRRWQEISKKHEPLLAASSRRSYSCHRCKRHGNGDRSRDTRREYILSSTAPTPRAMGLLQPQLARWREEGGEGRGGEPCKEGHEAAPPAQPPAAQQRSDRRRAWRCNAHEGGQPKRLRRPLTHMPDKCCKCYKIVVVPRWRCSWDQKGGVQTVWPDVPDPSRLQVGADYAIVRPPLLRQACPPEARKRTGRAHTPSSCQL